jgi:hypothetical protein
MRYQGEKMVAVPIFLLLVFIFMFTYLCTNTYASEVEDRKCREVEAEPLKTGEVLFAYSDDNKLDSLFIFDGKSFIDATGKEFKNIEEMQNLINGNGYPVAFSAYLTRMGPDRCIWFAEVKEGKLEGISIFASQRVDIDIILDKKRVELFQSIKTECIDQGDYPPNKKPPCTRPKLLATSDLDNDGFIEYWYTDPYTWNTGFAVAELDEINKTFSVISSGRCLDCD